jgi:hypothetical protein
MESTPTKLLALTHWNIKQNAEILHYLRLADTLI